MVSAWRNFKNIFSTPLFTIIFRPEMLKFHPYSILTGDTMVVFVIFCVLKEILWESLWNVKTLKKWKRNWASIKVSKPRIQLLIFGSGSKHLHIWVSDLRFTSWFWNPRNEIWKPIRVKILNQIWSESQIWNPGFQLPVSNPNLYFIFHFSKF